MAHLNLRDRIIEATIAYVGGSAGEATANFERVTRDSERGRAGALATKAVGTGQLLSLDWRPRHGARMNDCELSVTLVSAGEGLDAETMDGVLVDADGMVLMLEGTPDAADRNRLAVARVQGALARAPDRTIPVVVQVNRVDGAEIESTETLGAEGWPRVIACAAKGDGVMETLQRAVDGVVESMHQRGAADNAGARAPGSPRVEGNPLLAALRQILHTTVADQMAAMETRLVTKLGGARGADQAAPATSKDLEAIAERLAALEARAPADDGGKRASKTLAEIAALGERVARVEAVVVDARSKSAAREDVKRLEELLSEVASHREVVTDQLASLDRAVSHVSAALTAAAERAIAACERLPSKDDVARVEKSVATEAQSTRDGVGTTAKDLRRALAEETSRGIAAGLASALGPLKTAIDASASEVKKAAAKDATSTLTPLLEAVKKTSEELRARIDASAEESKTMLTRLEELESIAAEDGTAVTRRFTELGAALHAFAATADTRAEAVRVELEALTGEVKKKRSWFG